MAGESSSALKSPVRTVGRPPRHASSNATTCSRRTRGSYASKPRRGLARGANGRVDEHPRIQDAATAREVLRLPRDDRESTENRRALSAAFPVHAVQVDGGSELTGDFEQECLRRGIRLFVLPPRATPRWRPLPTLHHQRARWPAQRGPHWEVTVLVPSGLATMPDVIGCEPDLRQ